MRLRLLMRRLTVSAPRMAVRSALPWPFRWAMLAIVAGFCAAIALWAFEFGKNIAGLDNGTKEQLAQMRMENDALRGQLGVLNDERNKAQSVANTVDTLLIAEKVSQEKLTALNRQLEADNQQLKSDLGFFEQLIPASGGSAGIAIRGLQAEMQTTGLLKWQVLVIQAVKNPAEFRGQLELTFAGLENGKPWVAKLPAGSQPMVVKQYGRLDGLYPVPANVVIKNVTARVLEGQTVRAVQTLKL
jgi:hypothetical protein